MTTELKLTVVDAVALRRFDEPTMVRRLAALYRDRFGDTITISKAEARRVVKVIAGAGATTRLGLALYEEIERQSLVTVDRNGRREDWTDSSYYDPVVTIIDSMWGHDHDGSAYAGVRFKRDRMLGIFEHRLGGYDGYAKALDRSYSANVEVHSTSIIAGQIVALVEPKWRDEGRMQRTGVTRFLMVTPRSLRQKKAIAIKVPSVKTVADAVHSILPEAAVRGVNDDTRVDVDWAKRRFGVWDGDLCRWWPFRKVGITREGATTLGWRVVEARGDSWLRRLTRTTT